MNNPPLEFLNKVYLEEVNIKRADIDLDFDLSQTISGLIWKSIPNGHKWIHYFPIYDLEFNYLRGQPVKILEIGVYRGASLKLWKKFFGKEVTIIGIDIDSNCNKFSDPSNNIYVEIGSQSDPEFLNSINNKYGPFDLIIDDGSHAVSDQVTSFNSLFLEGLKDGGKYWIEDLEGNYWDNGLKDRAYTTMDLIKQLIDLQNSFYLNSNYEKFLKGSSSLQNEFFIPRISTCLEKISFYTGVSVISKKNKSIPLGVHL